MVSNDPVRLWVRVIGAQRNSPWSDEPVPGVVVLMGSSTLAARVAPVLNSRFPGSAYLIEQGRDRMDLLKSRIRTRGPVTAAGQVAFRWVLARMARAQSAQIDRLWQDADLPTKPLDESQIYRTTSVNAPEACDWIAAQEPDVVATFSVRKLAPVTLAACQAPILNLHPGITPQYRGMHTGYWALRQNDPTKFGVTVHLIDEGLDTGPIVDQIVCQPSGNIATMPSTLVLGGLPALENAIDAALSGQLAPRPAGPPAPLFYEPTLWSYVAGGLQSGVW